MEARMILVILIVAIAETAWALFCAATSVNLLVFYAVLVAASAIFWVPGIAEKRGAPQRASSGIPETNR
jgi:hypothetical protein